MAKEISEDGDCIVVTLNLLKLLKLKIPRNTISFHLKAHEAYPSLLSISDLLNDYGISNEAYRLDKMNPDLELLRMPFIGFLMEGKGRFLLVKSISQSIVSFSDSKTQNGEMLLTDFLKDWNGIFLQITGSTMEYVNKRSSVVDLIRIFRFPIALMLIFSIVIYISLSQSYTVYNVSLMVTKIFGLTISIFLLYITISSKSFNLQKLCNIGGKTNCNSLLRSNSAKIFSWLSWSEIAFVYFLGSLLFLLADPKQEFLISLLNLLALPVIIYSLFYQWRNQKWCLLCCTVILTLVVEFATIIFFNGYHFQGIDSTSILLSSMCFLSPVVCWVYLKPVLTKSEEVSTLQARLNRFVYNKDLFDHLLGSQQEYLVPNELHPIILGNPKSKNIVTIVSSLNCEPCADVHRVLRSWNRNGIDIRFNLLFTGVGYDEAARKMIDYLMMLSDLGNDTLIMEILSQWYEQKVVAKIVMEKARFQTESIDYVINQDNWFNYAEIQFTPTALFNGHKIPPPYKLEDLIQMLK